MRINIVGAGAMGGLVGGLLAKAGHEIYFLEADGRTVAALRERGLGLEMEGQREFFPCRATADPEAMPQSLLTLLLVKSYNTATAAVWLPRLMEPSGLVLSLQNGLGNAEELGLYWPKELILAGVTTMGAQVVEPGVTRYQGGRETRIGFWWAGDMEKAQGLARFFTHFGLPTVAQPDIRPAVWEKLLVNAAINPLTALTDMRNGELTNCPEIKTLMGQIVEEGKAVAQALGVEVRADILEYIYKVAADTAANRSSMWQDVHNQRLTEIDFINGALARLASGQGVAAPLNQALTALIKGREKADPLR